MDAKEALQYVYCIPLSSDQGNGIGKEQVEIAWELTRRIIVLANGGPAWEELVGGIRPDGGRFVSCFPFFPIHFLIPIFQAGVIEQGANLLHLIDSHQYYQEILARAAKHAEDNDRVVEAIKLYNLAEDYITVVACLAQALGNTIARATPDEKARGLEKTAAEILRHYERANRAVGRERDAIVRLLRIREAMDAKNAGRPEVALDVRFFLFFFSGFFFLLQC